MENNFIVVTIKENEKNLAYVIKNSSSYNLLCDLKIKNIVSANIFKTKKKAEEIAKFWNQCYKDNGTHLFY